MAGERSTLGVTTDTNLNDADQNVDALMWVGKWNTTSNNVVTFSFIDSGFDLSYTFVPGATFASAFSATQQAAVRTVLDMYASIADIVFQELAFGSPNGTLRFAEFNGIGTAWAYAPSSSEAGGDMGFNTVDFNSPLLGTYAFHTFMHEIAHSLGLKHGHENYQNQGTMTSDKDGMEYSITTYNSFIGQNQSPQFYTNSSGHYAQTLMMYDIAAIQRLYGATFTENATDTTYTFSTTTGQMFINGVGQGTPVANVIFRTVWDGNGEDTYDFSNFTNDLMIDLTPGGYSDLDVGGNDQRAKLNAGWNSAGVFVGSAAEEYASGHLYNALQFNGDARSLIENAKGGSGNDEIEGNIANNKLYGGDGDDMLRGREGNDKLFGNKDKDTLKGGKGKDEANGGDGADKAYGGDGSDKINGNDGGDELYGDKGSDEVSGGKGSDEVYGGDGKDDVNGNKGSDKVYGNKGNDSVFGGDGNDMVYGGDGNDKVYGNAGKDNVYGNAGNDTLYGGADNDRMIGGGGDDTIYGNNGVDTFVYNGDANTGTDTIKDFNNGSEKIEISGSIVYADLTISQVGGDKHITWNGNTIILEGITGTINANDFDFV